LDEQTLPYKIFNKNGIKVGIFGLGIDLESTVNKSLYKETKYLNPIEAAEHYADLLKNREKCDIVICLSHLGYEYENDTKKASDKILVAQSQNIDVILGGHTHTFLPKPEIFKNKIGENVIINQVGWAGLYLGRIDLYLDNNNKLQHLAWENKLIDNRIVV
jgi:5'-nucleotidase